MKENNKTQEQLVNELAEMHQKIAKLEAAETERKRAEEGVEKETLRRDILMAAYRDGIAIINQEHQVVEANERFAEMLGYTPEEVLSLHTWDWEAVTTEAEIRANFVDLTKINTVFETRHRRKDGTIFDVEVSASGTRVGDEVLGFTISRDITERKQTEKALRESEENLAKAQSIAHLGSWKWDSTNNTRIWSDEFYRILGLEPQSIEPSFELMMEHVHPDDREYVIKAARELEGEHKPYGTLEHRIIRPDGTERFIQGEIRVQFDKEGKPTKIIGTMLDITERKRAEETLKIKDHAIASSISGFAITDLAGNLTYVNHSWLQMNGYDDEKEVLGRRSEEFFFAKENVLAIMEGLPDKGGWEGELVARRRDGSLLDLYLTASIVTDEDGKPICIMASGIDITERKQAEEELRKYRDHLEELVKERTTALQQEIEERKRTEVELQHTKEAALDALRAAEAANKLKSEFLANMSHDIRTPLNAVLGFAEILKERLRGFPQYHSFLDGIIDGGRTLLHLINDILDLSRIEAGRLEIRPEAVNLPAVLTEIQQMFASKVRSMGIAFTLHISPDTPDTMLLDGNRLRQILMNLVSNAVKFTEKGNVSLRVYEFNELDEFNEFRELSNLDNSKTQKLKNSKTLCFEIEDTGIGIPEEDQGRMFEPFQQHDPRSPGGTGLGLAITKRLVELMHGTIAVESTVNEGTLFRVLLPAIGITARTEEGTARKPGEQIHFHGATILLVEDNASSREVVRAYIAPHDLHLIEAENGQEALQMLKPRVGFRPDLILMDIRMPVMDGYEATQRIKADPELRVIPVVALTAYAVKEQVEKYQDLYDAYLSKPISKAALIATLAKFLPHTKSPGKKRGKEESIPPLRQDC